MQHVVPVLHVRLQVGETLQKDLADSLCACVENLTELGEGVAIHFDEGEYARLLAFGHETEVNLVDIFSYFYPKRTPAPSIS